ncbi:MAG: L,D-transpeptidase [Anaerolineaceae bacterium]
MKLKNTLMIFFAVMILLLAIQTIPVIAASGETFTGEPLCLPGIYRQQPDDCLALGPSDFLTDLDAKGIHFPLRPLPSHDPDPALTLSPVPYLKVGENAFPVYNSLEDAKARSSSRYLEAGMKYLAMSERLDLEDGVYYRLANGLWIEAGEANTECCIYSGRFQGLLFYQNPTNSFGWIIDATDVLSAPGYSSEPTGQKLSRENVVQIYDMVEANGTDWYMIGWNQWVERRKIRQFHVNTIAPEGVDNGRWIEVNLYEQTLGIYEDNKLVFATLIASGVEPFYTRPGLFQIYKKLEKGNMSGAFESDRSDFYYLEDVPFTLYYDEARALHGAYWRTLFGYPQSHGCVNLSIGDSQIVYNWANVGDWVYVWDPSGETPTDPDFYGAGGA